MDPFRIRCGTPDNCMDGLRESLLREGDVPEDGRLDGRREEDD